jgi:hypothetical protein
MPASTTRITAGNRNAKIRENGSRAKSFISTHESLAVTLIHPAHRAGDREEHVLQGRLFDAQVLWNDPSRDELGGDESEHRTRPAR